MNQSIAEPDGEPGSRSAPTSDAPSQRSALLRLRRSLPQGFDPSKGIRSLHPAESVISIRSLMRDE